MHDYKLKTNLLNIVAPLHCPSHNNLSCWTERPDLPVSRESLLTIIQGLGILQSWKFYAFLGILLFYMESIQYTYTNYCAAGNSNNPLYRIKLEKILCLNCLMSIKLTASRKLTLRNRGQKTIIQSSFPVKVKNFEKCTKFSSLWNYCWSCGSTCSRNFLVSKTTIWLSLLVIW